jgi:Peptidase A4 family
VNQGGTWLIHADRQPTTASPARSMTPGPAGQSPAPVPTLAADGQDTWRNWSGYAASGGSYTGISGTWTVPQVVPSADGASGVGATWVGIGGMKTRDLIQAGTEDSGSGRQNEYQACIEILPAASKQVPLAVGPGDSITEQGAGSQKWLIVMTDNRSAKTYQTTVSHTSSLHR